jgi:Methyltransferase domain
MSLIDQLRSLAQGFIGRRVGAVESTPADDSLSQRFAAVYEGKRWGGRRHKFYSGPGSHDNDIVEPYVASVLAFLRSLPTSPTVVDIGCGDFNVGRRIRHACGRYIACDVVESLIEHNRSRYREMEVDFRCLDIVADPLPEGDIGFVRQVFQHLSNAQILEALPKLSAYRYLVITEHMPSTRDFVANVDHCEGSGTRLASNSGVVLTSPPFDLNPLSTKEIARVYKYGGAIVTNLYEMRGFGS